MHVLEDLVGTHYEIGCQRGEALKPLVWEHLERMKYLAVQASPFLSPEELISRFISETGHLQAAQRWTPHLLDEVRGISQGAKIPFEHVFVLCCLDELWRYSQALSGLPACACSSLGCFREEDSPALLGQNLDTEYVSKNLAAVLHIRGPDQPEAYVVCHASNLGWMGLNRAPLGVCVNTLHLVSSREGLPVQFIAREILRKPSLPEAVDFLTHVRQGAAQNFMIGDADQVVDFEASANRCVRYVPHDGARRLYHTNHPLANDDYIPSYPVFYQNSLDRFRYLEYRLKDPSRPVSLENVKGILRSHSGPICSHSNHDPGTSSTWISVIYRLSTPPELYVAEGNPCETEYRRFTFPDRHGQEP